MTHLESDPSYGRKTQPRLAGSVQVDDNTSRLAPARVPHRRRVLLTQRRSPGKRAGAHQDGGKAAHSILTKS